MWIYNWPSITVITYVELQEMQKKYFHIDIFLSSSVCNEVEHV